MRWSRAWLSSSPGSLRLDGKFPDDAARAQAALRSVQADVMVVAAYGLILPQWVLDLPPLGCLNIHASLLPRWRGRRPSIAPSRPVMRKRVSPSCRWMRAWTLGTCC